MTRVIINVKRLGENEDKWTRKAENIRKADFLSAGQGDVHCDLLQGQNNDLWYGSGFLAQESVTPALAVPYHATQREGDLIS